MGFSTTKRNLQSAKIVKSGGGVLIGGKNKTLNLKKKYVKLLNKYGKLVPKIKKLGGHNG